MQLSGLLRVDFYGGWQRNYQYNLGQRRVFNLICCIELHSMHVLFDSIFFIWLGEEKTLQDTVNFSKQTSQVCGWTNYINSDIGKNPLSIFVTMLSKCSPFKTHWMSRWFAVLRRAVAAAAKGHRPKSTVHTAATMQNSMRFALLCNATNRGSLTPASVLVFRSDRILQRYHGPLVLWMRYYRMSYASSCGLPEG